MFTEILTIWSDQPGLSLAVWVAMLILVMYLGRSSSHQLIKSLGRSIHSSMRLCSRALESTRLALEQRNKEVILSTGLENMERTIEREFARVQTIVARDLNAYPALHRQISDTINAIEEDYHSTTEAPPLPPAWLDAVAAVAAIPRTGDQTVCKILENIQESLQTAHKETLAAYQKSSLERHKKLGRIQPLWASLSRSLGVVGKSVDSLHSSSESIDKHMQEYEAIRANEDIAARRLTASSLTQFFIAALVLGIAMLGGLINFQLIAMPMSEMVGGGSYIGGMRTSDIAALVIIMIEVAMGLFLMESLRITHLFPVISSMDDRMRKRMMVVTFSILAILAGIEASLAYMRDLLALDNEALTQSLAGVAVAEAEFRWIPSIGQMVMGFILPFALAFVAIPLESFMHSLRTVIGLLLVGIIQSLMMLSRLLGNVAMYASKIIISLYDLIIMIPLSIERVMPLRSRKILGSDDLDENNDLKKENI